MDNEIGFKILPVDFLFFGVWYDSIKLEKNTFGNVFDDVLSRNFFQGNIKAFSIALELLLKSN